MIRLISLLVLLAWFCLPARAEDDAIYPQFYGTWQVEQSENTKNIFEDFVHIMSIKTRPGSLRKNMLLIYDSALLGFLCSTQEQAPEEVACSVIKVNKPDVTPDDLSHLVTNPLQDMPFMMLSLKYVDDRLLVLGYPIDEYYCIRNGECEVMVLSALKK